MKSLENCVENSYLISFNYRNYCDRNNFITFVNVLVTLQAGSKCKCMMWKRT